ncbi:MAG TPA: antibiotic biosynthesis monooxygenase [Candidatus Binatus sp.]|nr:antibiotic biosynthesis monooxygenase [Candidatus Binatus sp.]
MIVRTWRGRTSISNQSAYLEHFRRSVIPELQAIKGFRGASLLIRNLSGEVEVFVLTKWTSLEAIRMFAGNAIEKAVVAPEAAAVLVEYDRAVRHYEVVHEMNQTD